MVGRDETNGSVEGRFAVIRFYRAVPVRRDFEAYPIFDRSLLVNYPNPPSICDFSCNGGCCVISRGHGRDTPALVAQPGPLGSTRSAALPSCKAA
jgi:hypothetical protein